MSKHLSRRSVLRGAGVALSLPLLEAMTRNTLAKTAAASPIKRVAFFYVPNGIHMNAWRPNHSGELQELPEILKPLEPHKKSVSVISNLAAQHCNGEGAAHEPAGGGFLVGAKCKHSEEPEVGGVSVDQVVAKEYGFQTPVDSLALGIDPGHRGDHGYSGTYMSHISWRSKTVPAALELNPRQLYERLFHGQTPRKLDNAESRADRPKSLEGSLLDLVAEDARSLQRKLGYRDKRKLEQYLDGLRSVEKSIEAAGRDAHSHHQGAFEHDPLLHADEHEIPELIIPDGKGIPSVYGDHVNLMLDILTLAFQTDTTRVASFMFSYEKSGRSYPEINAPGSHHSTSHHEDKEANHRELTNINRHHIELFSRMLNRMSDIDEEGRSLLDNTLMLYGSGISDGNKHNHDDLPILVAGAGGDWIPGGRHYNLETATPICNLYMSMLQYFGVEASKFGDSTGVLELA